MKALCNMWLWTRAIPLMQVWRLAESQLLMLVKLALRT